MTGMKESYPRAAALVALAVFLLAGGACRRASRSEPVLRHFIDALSPEGVIESPLRQAGSAGLKEEAFPFHSYPMDEAGIGDPAFGIKRKLDLGTVEMDILFAPPRSEFRFDLPSHAAAMIRFGAGIVRDAHAAALNSGSAGPGEGVDFRIVLEARDRKRILFQKTIAMPPDGQARSVNFQEFSLPLPAADKPAALTLLTSGSPNAFAFWHDPTLHVPGRAARGVVLISIDTLRPDHLGAYGYPRAVSPALDALAADGAVFLNAYSSSPWTLPAHISLLTGLDCIRHRVYYEDEKLSPRLPTLAEMMRKAGYACGAVTGGGFVNARYGFSRGFAEYGMGQGDLQDSRLAEKGGRKAAAWLEKNADRPFFLFVHTYQVHGPYKSPDPYPSIFLGEGVRGGSLDLVGKLGGRGFIFKPLSEAEKSEALGLYDAGIRYTDDALVGPLVGALRRLGLYDQTMIVITSDHGEEFFEHGGWDHTHGVYDEQIRIPLIVKMPRSDYKGSRLHPVVRLTDIMPSILDEAGVKYDPETLDGRSLRPLLAGKEKGDRVFLAELAENVVDVHIPQRVATNESGRKVILNQPFSKEQMEFFRTPPLVPPAVELYDLTADPGERRNLFGRLEEEALSRALVLRARQVVLQVPARGKGRTRPNKELEDQLRSLGYIK